MKVKLIVLSIILLGVCFLFSRSDEFRIRVIANSDSYSDQEIKKEIASAIDEYIVENNVTKNNITSHISNIEMIVKEYNVEYTIEITKENFPTKEVNGNISNGGYYQTLLIKLGNAQGKNYFSVLYPDYYNISYEEVQTGEVEYKSWFYEQFKKLFN